MSSIQLIEDDRDATRAFGIADLGAPHGQRVLIAWTMVPIRYAYLDPDWAWCVHDHNNRD